MQQKFSAVPERRRLKIGFVLDDSLDRPDGVQQYVLTVGEWLRRRGHDVHYLVSATSRDDVDNIHSLARNIGVRFNGNRMRMPLPASPYYLRQFLAREQFDVLHVQMPYSPLFGARVINAAGKHTAVVGTFHVVPHSWYVRLASRLLAAMTVRSLHRFDNIVSVSPSAQVFAREAFGVKSEVVPAAIPLEDFKNAQPRRKKKHGLEVLFMGRLVYRKGCMLLLQATEQLVADRSVPPFHVTICGRGPLSLELEKYVTEHNLQKRVTFEGFVSEEDKPHYFAAADVSVFPSNGGESFGIVLVEAMASGQAAVLAGDNTGYRGVLNDCPGDVLFDPNDARALATTLRRVLTDPAMRRHIAAWQERHARSFDIDRIGPRLARTYVSALRHRRNMR